jgi:hypothetical protein
MFGFSAAMHAPRSSVVDPLAREGSPRAGAACITRVGRFPSDTASTDNRHVNVRKLAEIGGIAAGVVLIGFGIAVTCSR